MLIKGYWAEFWDGAIRPLIQGEVELPGGGWQEVRFLLDGGADRTVLEARLLPLLAPLPACAAARLRRAASILSRFKELSTNPQSTRSPPPASNENSPDLRSAAPSFR